VLYEQRRPALPGLDALNEIVGPELLGAMSIRCLIWMVDSTALSAR